MSELSDLLHRASQLAPEWCRYHEAMSGVIFFQLPSTSGWHGLGIDGSCNDHGRALILWEVLTEAKARGCYYQILRAMFDADARDGPCEAALSALVRLMESEVATP